MTGALLPVKAGVSVTVTGEDEQNRAANAAYTPRRTSFQELGAIGPAVLVTFYGSEGFGNLGEVADPARWRQLFPTGQLGYLELRAFAPPDPAS